jgi:hypothetical protein
MMTAWVVPQFHQVLPPEHSKPQNYAMVTKDIWAKV